MSREGMHARFTLPLIALLAALFAAAAPGFAQEDTGGTSFITPFPPGDTYNLVMIGDDLAEGLLGGALEIFSNMHGGELTLSDFHYAWFVVAAVAVCSAIPFLRLPPDAGSDVSGHRVKVVDKPVPATV